MQRAPAAPACLPALPPQAADHFPWFLPTYDSLPDPVMRADAVRVDATVTWAPLMREAAAVPLLSGARLRPLGQHTPLAWRQALHYNSSKQCCMPEPRAPPPPPPNVQARYMYLWLYGGVYADLGGWT